MPAVLQPADAYEFIQQRIDSHEFWIMPVTTVESAALACRIAKQHYRGQDEHLFNMLSIPTPLSGVPFFYLVLAAKKCLPANQLAEVIGAPVPANVGDVLVPPGTHRLAVLWLKNLFRWGPA